MTDDKIPREALDLVRETNEAIWRIAHYRQWPTAADDWERTVTECLVKLTRFHLNDGRKLKGPTGAGLGSGSVNWLLKPARLWEELFHNSTRGVGSKMELAFGPVIRVDANITLVVVFGHDNPFRLVWPQGEDFGYRMLCDLEGEMVSYWCLNAVRQLGFVGLMYPSSTDRLVDDPKPKRPSRRRRGSQPPDQPD